MILVAKKCLKEEMWKHKCKAGQSVASNILEELYHLMPRTIADLIYLIY